MILVKRAPAGCIAQLYAEERVEFDERMEQELNRQGFTPPPPDKAYGPGGRRLILHTFLDETGEWCPTPEEAVRSLQSRKRIKAAQRRVHAAEVRLERERARLAALTSDQRVFDEDTGDELTLGDV